MTFVFSPGVSSRYPTRCGYSAVDLGGAYGTLVSGSGFQEVYYDSFSGTFNVTVGTAGVPVTLSLLQFGSVQLFAGTQKIGSFSTRFAAMLSGVNPLGSSDSAATELGGGFVRFTWPSAGIATGPNTAPAALISTAVAQYSITD